MANPIVECLRDFQQRLAEKRFLHTLTKGWECQVGLYVVDQGARLLLTFSFAGCTIGEWPQGMQVHLRLAGRERDFLRLFSGDELSYLLACPSIRQTGPLRDRLKLDALLRLTAQETRGLVPVEGPCPADAKN